MQKNNLKNNYIIMEYKVDFSIYRIEKIQLAIDDFKEITKIELWDNILIIKWDYSNNEFNEIFNEFMNYVLSIIN